jgi:hypothetical protein
MSATKTALSTTVSLGHRSSRTQGSPRLTRCSEAGDRPPDLRQHCDNIWRRRSGAPRVRGARASGA